MLSLKPNKVIIIYFFRYCWNHWIAWIYRFVWNAWVFKALRCLCVTDANFVKFFFTHPVRSGTKYIYGKRSQLSRLGVCGSILICGWSLKLYICKPYLENNDFLWCFFFVYKMESPTVFNYALGHLKGVRKVKITNRV